VNVTVAQIDAHERLGRDDGDGMRWKVGVEGWRNQGDIAMQSPGGEGEAGGGRKADLSAGARK
jgi:hypothetical protein